MKHDILYKTDIERKHSDMETLKIRMANRADVPLILELIKELAEYEHMRNEVVAEASVLEEWIFDKEKAEVMIGEYQGKAIGFALFFYNFSTFLGRCGIYLEDLYIKTEYRNQGFGKVMLQKLAQITVARGCGRLEWCCLDWNTPSIDFYKSLGAQSMDDWTTYRISGERLQEFGKLE